MGTAGCLPASMAQRRNPAQLLPCDPLPSLPTLAAGNYTLQVAQVLEPGYAPESLFCLGFLVDTLHQPQGPCLTGLPPALTPILPGTPSKLTPMGFPRLSALTPAGLLATQLKF